MNNFIARTAGAAPVPREARSIVRQTQMAGLKLDGLAALYGKAIERSVDLYDQAEFLAATRPELRPVLAQYQLAFARQAQNHISRHDSPFGF